MLRIVAAQVASKLPACLLLLPMFQTSDAAPRVGTPANDVASRCVTVFGFNPDGW